MPGTSLARLTHSGNSSLAVVKRNSPNQEEPNRRQSSHCPRPFPSGKPQGTVYRRAGDSPGLRAAKMGISPLRPSRRCPTPGRSLPAACLPQETPPTLASPHSDARYAVDRAGKAGRIVSRIAAAARKGTPCWRHTIPPYCRVLGQEDRRLTIRSLSAGELGSQLQTDRGLRKSGPPSATCAAVQQ